jgi:beta-xylosidase/AraC-like DNA-binding protein
MTDTEKSYDGLREIFAALTREYAAGEHQTRAYTDSLLLKLLDTLIEEFQVKNIGVGEDRPESDQRMKEMMQYIFSNLDQELSLNDLAEQMFISPSTLSRVFKKNTGQYFADFVLEIRIKNAMNLLAHTGMNVTQIALACGFTNSASFNRAFRKKNGMTPLEYRKLSEKQQTEEVRPADDDIKKELIRKEYASERKNTCENAVIDVSADGKDNYGKPWQEIINLGAISLLSAANMQFHALYLSEQLHFRYYRVWNIFDKKLMITDGTQIGHYNYDMIDQIFDFMVSHKLKPFLDFGRRPNAAFRAYGNSVYLQEDCIDFKSKKIWKHMINDFIRHLIVRYGEDEVSDWKFELTRNGFHDKDVEDHRLYEDDNYDFYEAFEIFWRAVRDNIPAAAVGGVGGTVINDRSYLVDFYRRCAEAKTAPDFISLIVFPYVQSEKKESGRRLSGNEDYERDIIAGAKELKEAAGLDPSTPVLITEWNNTLSNRNYLNDSSFRAAYIAGKMAGLIDEVDAIGIMGGSDWISNYMDSVGILNGAVGLLSKDTIRKPAFFAVEFLNQMGNRLIGRGKNYIVTRKDNGEIYILTFHQSWFRNSYLFREEDLGIRVVDSHIYNTDRKLELRMRIEGLLPGKVYCVKQRTLNREHGSALAEWKKFQYDTSLNRPDVKYIDAISIPHLTKRKVKLGPEEHEIDLHLEMEVHEIDLIHIFTTEE